jgi:hypothetical protein
MTVNQISKKSISLFLATWIRLVILSGIEMFKQLKFAARPQAVVQNLSASEWAFPLSSWICEQERLFCLIARRGDPEVSVFELPRMGKN